MIVIFGDPGFGFAYDPARIVGAPSTAARPRLDPQRWGPAPRSSSGAHLPGGDDAGASIRRLALAPASRHGFRSSRRGEGASLDPRPARRLGLAASDESTTTGGRSGRATVAADHDPGLRSIEDAGHAGSQARLGCERAARGLAGVRQRVGGIRRHPAPPLRPQRRRLVRPWFLHPGHTAALTIGAVVPRPDRDNPRRHLDPLTSIC